MSVSMMLVFLVLFFSFLVLSSLWKTIEPFAQDDEDAQDDEEDEEKEEEEKRKAVVTRIKNAIQNSFTKVMDNSKKCNNIDTTD